MSDVTPRPPHRPLVWPDSVLDLSDWLSDSATPIYIVGGAVRDALLNKPLKDLDLAVESGGMALARRIANHLRGDFFALDAERDVGRALVDTTAGHFTIDVARFRGNNLLADLSDRDFTMNAMAVDLRHDLSVLIDPLGGERDIQTRQIRRCASHAIASDPIRALRAVRQSVQFGMRIEPETLRDVRAAKGRLGESSPERVRDEFIRMVTVGKPASALRVADTLGLLDEIIPELRPLHGFAQGSIEDSWQHTLAVVEAMTNILQAISPARSDNTASSFGLGMLVMQLDRFRERLNAHINTLWPNERPHQALLILAALLHDTGKSQNGNELVSAKIAGERADLLHLSNSEKQRLVTILCNYVRPLLMDNPTPLELHRFWWQTRAAGVDACLLAAAEFLGTAGGELNQDAWLVIIERIRILFEAYFERYDEIVEPIPLLDGNQLMEALDLKPGPVIGQLIERIREAQATGEAQTVDDALRAAKAYLNSDHHK
jgi:tRNA nucleotidyltransferase/poly(A) polymerase